MTHFLSLDHLCVSDSLTNAIHQGQHYDDLGIGLDSTEHRVYGLMEILLIAGWDDIRDLPH